MIDAQLLALIRKNLTLVLWAPSSFCLMLQDLNTCSITSDISSSYEVIISLFHLNRASIEMTNILVVSRLSLMTLELAPIPWDVLIMKDHIVKTLYYVPRYFASWAWIYSLKVYFLQWEYCLLLLLVFHFLNSHPIDILLRFNHSQRISWR